MSSSNLQSSEAFRSLGSNMGGYWGDTGLCVARGAQGEAHFYCGAGRHLRNLHRGGGISAQRRLRGEGMVRGCTSFIVNYLQLRGAGGGVGG